MLDSIISVSVTKTNSLRHLLFLQWQVTPVVVRAGAAVAAGSGSVAEVANFGGVEVAEEAEEAAAARLLAAR